MKRLNSAYVSQKEIASANFSLEDCGTLINGSWFKAIPNFVLPKVSFYNTIKITRVSFLEEKSC